MRQGVFSRCFCCKKEVEADSGDFLPSKTEIGKFFFVCDECVEIYPGIKEQFSGPVRFGKPCAENITTWDNELSFEINTLAANCEIFLNLCRHANLTPEILKQICRVLYCSVKMLGEGLPR